MRHLLFSNQHDLNACISLPTLPVSIPSNSIQNGVALITGATGFIGGFLLKELLQNNSFESYICVVRGEDEATGFERVRANLISKGTPEELISPSLISIRIGDVLEVNFGLPEKEYLDLCTNVDHLFHFAATMNWVTPFNNDTLANIAALKTAVQFCGTTRLKKLHYASSMGMWTLLNHTEGPILETMIHKQGNELPGGYFQSKWINENILQLASKAGIPVNVYRIGDVKGDSENGLGDPQNFGNLFMQYLIRSGVAIDEDIPKLDFIPVDFLAKAIAHISVTETNKTFQFSNPELVSFKDMHRAAIASGHDTRLVSEEDWMALVKSDTSEYGKRLKPVFKLFNPDPSLQPTSFYQIGVEMFQKEHDTTNTDSALEGTGITCPRMLSDHVLEKYLMHLGEAVAS